MQALFNEFRQVVVDAVRQFRCREWSICMEVSLHSSECGRIHLHGFLDRHCQQDRSWFRWSHIESCLKIRGVLPSHGSPCNPAIRGKNRFRAMIEGHYYCQAPKLGQILNQSSAPVFEKIFPDSRMVLTLWRTRKMCTETAKTEVLKTRDKVPAVIALLNATMSLEYQSRMDQDVAECESRWKRAPFRPPLDCELVWVRQYAVVSAAPHLHMSRAAQFCRPQDMDTSASLRRFKFLIYDGPSQLGKTEMALAWFGTNNTLVVNSQDVTSPNLRPMHSGKYTGIVFDEASWKLCARNKMLFQASTRRVEMSQSQCNDRCYSVVLFRVPIIICSNNFWGGCDCAASREWIEKNSFYVEATTPMYVIS